MDIRSQRSWMYNRLYPGRKGLTLEFLNGVEEFIEAGMNLPSFSVDGMLRCPCSKHKNTAYLTIDQIKLDLYKKGFQPNYWYWSAHGEIDPELMGDQFAASTSSQFVSSTSYQEPQIVFEDPILEMINDAHNAIFPPQVGEIEAPNNEAQKFYELLDASYRPLWEGCTTHSELTVALKMMSIKTEHNISRNCFNDFATLLRETNPQDNLVPQDLYKAKKIVSRLGLTSIKIDCCINGCMIFYQQDEEADLCKFCGHPRFKLQNRKNKKLKNIPYQRMFYMPLIPRLQRLYASMRTAEHMRWHYSHSFGDNDMIHPADGQAWKHFDRTYPSFAADPRNVRLGLCADGFTPYSQAASPYSCWPVIVTPYNLPPEMCMTTPFMFLSLIIPGPHNPKGRIDVFLQPLLDELKLLWDTGVLTYDIAGKQNFMMRAALMWTINDFPAYGMLSGWSTAGKLACPYCMDLSQAFTLKNGRKNSWFDCHRMFLPSNHPFRRNKDAFKKNKIERSTPPPRLTGDDLFGIVSQISLITEAAELHSNRLPDFGITHNWTKQSIFWTLPYWRTNLIRHNLDVMHIEKNFFDNIFNTVFNVKGKTKDNIKTRLDLKDICRRRDLELKETHGGKLLMPKARYCLTVEQRRSICEWLQTIRFPTGYASNLSRRVELSTGKILGMKSHDCHIFLQCLLPTAFSSLPSQVLNPLIEISTFFKELCATTLKNDILKSLEENIPLILCKLERIFPPGFFDVMEHLPVHLSYEVIMGGPVQYRWMYPFERFLNRIKRSIKNKSRPEGSICEAYLLQETTTFCTYYFDAQSRSQCKNVNSEDSKESLSIFKHFGVQTGRCSSRYLSDKEKDAAHLYILLNCEEVEPYIELFVESLNIDDDVVINKMINDTFAKWFDGYAHNPSNDITDQRILDLAWGPNRLVTTWPIFEVNGYKFHTDAWSEGKKTCNSGVSVKGNSDSAAEIYYYGVLDEIVQLSYPGPLDQNIFLFNCHWFDPTPNRGTRVISPYNITEVRLNKRYGKFDPFVLANQAHQVFYLKYPGKLRDKQDWAVVIKGRPKAVIEAYNTLESAYQEKSMSGLPISDCDAEGVEILTDQINVFDEVSHDVDVSDENSETGFISSTDDSSDD